MAVAVGQQAPGFTLLNGAGDEVSLSDFSGKNVIVAFFPAVFSGVCDTEMCTFRERCFWTPSKHPADTPPILVA